MMKNVLIWLLVGFLALMSLKLVGAVLAFLLPFAILSLLLAIPVGFVVLVGWGASALLRGLTSATP